MHLHLEPVGGVAGDMFAAALLDAWPERADELLAAMAAAGLDRVVRVEHLAHDDGVLTGSRFSVHPVTPATEHDHHYHHPHRPFRQIRTLLGESGLAAPVRERAVDIFRLLAEAEGRVHGVDPEDVEFHEVGAWDSIADVVAAAWLIDAVGEAGWSCAPLPMGSGRVRTAHGDLPVPAPATALLLEGFPLFQDGHPGERVTPTGAAIVRHLDPTFEPLRAPMRLAGSGVGFGTRRFEGMSNVLRVLVFAPAGIETVREPVTVCGFEIDDQSPEDLAVALDNLRAVEGVLDVLQHPVHGKKGRLGVHVQLLAAPHSIDAVIDACFTETTTLGVRYETVSRAVLARESEVCEVAGGSVRVKRARRPGGVTTRKAEMDDVAAAGGGRAGRTRVRGTAEATSGAERDD